MLQAAIANFGTTTRKATILLSTGSGTEATQNTVAIVSVRPNSVMTTEIPTPSAEQMPENSVVVQADGAPGEIRSDIQAVSNAEISPIMQTLPWKDKGQMENGGQHPWNASNSVLSALVIFNPDTTLTNDSIRLTIRTGQASWTKILSLAPLATKAVSINDIIQKQEPDENGQKLPPNSSQGIVTWLSLKNPRIFGKLLQLDQLTSVARSYACTAIVTVCDAEPGSSNLTVGGSTNTYVDTLACYSTYGCGNCDGWCGDEGGTNLQSYWWSVANSGIASLTTDPSNVWAGLQGNSAGQTTLSVSVTDGNGCPGYGDGPVNVTCAVPVNFRVISPHDIGGGVLEMHYAWDSSTGNINDLSGCSVREYVAFDPPYIPYFDWPSPPFPPGIREPNPGIISLAATEGIVVDHYLLPRTDFPTPYSEGSYTAHQWIQYTCSCANGGNPVNLSSQNDITHTVAFSGDGDWYYSVSGWGAAAYLYLP